MDNPHTKNSLNSLIWSGLYYYPMLYKHGGDVVHHLFCVIGNGYSWKDGCLRNLYDDEREDRDVFQEPSEYEDVDNELGLQFKLDRLRENHRIEFTRQHIDELTLDVHRNWNSVYPISEYSGLSNVPDDAQLDFVTGARIAIDLSYGVLAKYGCKQEYYDRDGTRHYHDGTKSCIHILDESLQSIIERFGPNPLGIQSNRYKLWKSFNDYVRFQRGHTKRVKQSLDITW